MRDGQRISLSTVTSLTRYILYSLNKQTMISLNHLKRRISSCKDLATYQAAGFSRAIHSPRANPRPAGESSIIKPYHSSMQMQRFGKAARILPSAGGHCFPASAGGGETADDGLILATIPRIISVDTPRAVLILPKSKKTT